MESLRTWVEINLDNLEYNYKNIKKKLDGDTKIMAVIKADGYGHGSVQVAKCLEKLGCDCFAVAFSDEGVQLRNHGIKKPILILGTSGDDCIDNIIKYNLMPTVYRLDFAEKLSDAAQKAGKTVMIHIKLDTGMGRIGLQCGEGNDSETVETIKKISMLKNICIQGIFTHFATADEEDSTRTYIQFNKFRTVLRLLENEGIHIPLRHCANSAATVLRKEMHMDMVRPGIIMYGHYPSKYMQGKGIDLKPVMTLKSSVAEVKTVEKGSEISYGGTFKAPENMRVATIGLGYADGLLRMLSNKLCVCVNGEKVRQIGKICMDQCMIDVTNVNNISVGDEVVVFGEDKPVEELADICGTINYEILCMVGKRVPRVYMKNGKITKIISYLV